MEPDVSTEPGTNLGTELDLDTVDASLRANGSAVVADDRLAHAELEPGGQRWFGAEGSVRWTTLWRCAALLAGSRALRNLDPAEASTIKVFGTEFFMEAARLLLEATGAARDA